MTVRIDSFLGRELIVPEDRLYDPAEGLWILRLADGRLAVGITEPALLMAGTVREIERLMDDGLQVAAGQTVLLALTARLKYLASPVAGTVTFPPQSSDLAARLAEHPYETVLFFISPEDEETKGLTDVEGYAASLRDAEGARNPGGHKGGVSPTCKAVYMGLGEQKLS